MAAEYTTGRKVFVTIEPDPTLSKGIEGMKEFAKMIREEISMKDHDNRIGKNAYTTGMVAKEQSPDGPLRIIATTNDLDRDGEIVEPRGVRNLDGYMKNPVVLFGHNWGGRAVGRAVDYRLTDNSLELDIEWAGTAEGEELRTLYDGGFMRSFSIGFIPKKIKIIDEVLHYVEWDLLEVSAVAIPANEFATVVASAEKNGLALPAMKSLFREDAAGAGKAKRQESSDDGTDVVEPDETELEDHMDPDKIIEEAARKAAESALAALEKREAEKAAAAADEAEKAELEQLKTAKEAAESKLEELKRQMKAGAFAGELEDDDQGDNVKVVDSPYKGRSLRKAADAFMEIREQKGDRRAIERAKSNPKRLEKALKSMADLVDNAKTFEDPAQVKDMVGQTTTAGGFLVNDELRDEILSYGRYSSIALRKCRIESMASDVQLFPRENAKFSLAFTAENTEATETSPTLTQVTVTAKELTGYAEVSWALEQDASNVVGLLLDQVAEEFGLTLDETVLDGSGDPMSGIFDATTSYSVVLAGSNFSEITMAKLREAISKVKPQDRMGASWVSSTSFLWTYLYNIQQSSRDVFIPADDPEAGPSGRLMGFDVEESEAAPSAAGSGNPVLVYGNLNSVIIGERLVPSMTLFRNPYRKATERLTQYLFFARVGMADALPLKRCRIITG